MVKIIETNIIESWEWDRDKNGNGDFVKDIQSRVIEVESWQSYIDIVLGVNTNEKDNYKRDIIGCLDGNVKPKYLTYSDIIYKDIKTHRLIIKYFEKETMFYHYKFAYRIHTQEDDYDFAIII